MNDRKKELLVIKNEISVDDMTDIIKNGKIPYFLL